MWDASSSSTPSRGCRGCGQWTFTSARAAPNHTKATSRQKTKPRRRGSDAGRVPTCQSGGRRHFSRGWQLPLWKLSAGEDDVEPVSKGPAPLPPWPLDGGLGSHHWTGAFLCAPDPSGSTHAAYVCRMVPWLPRASGHRLVAGVGRPALIGAGQATSPES